MNRFTLIISIVFLSLFLNSCFDFPERCGMDYERMEYELWSLSMNDFSSSKVYTWESQDSYSGYNTHFRIYGITPDGRNIYYTNNHISSVIYLYKLDLIDAQVKLIQSDNIIGDYVLSPDGELFVFKNNSGIWVSNIEGDTKRRIPKADSLYTLIAPKWYIDNNRLVVAAAKQGIWIVDLIDSTYTKISDRSSDQYDLSEDGSKIVLQENESSGYPLIRYKFINSEDLITLNRGTSPKFINNDNAIIFEQSDGIYASDLEGEKKKIFSKTGGGDRSRNRQVAVSPDNYSLGYADQEGLHIYDTSTEKILFTSDIDEFMPSETGSWNSITIQISELIFSEDNETIYFIVDRRFFSDGC